MKDIQISPVTVDLGKSSRQLRHSSCPLCHAFGCAPSTGYYSQDIENLNVGLRKINMRTRIDESARLTFLGFFPDFGDGFADSAGSFLSVNSHQIPEDDWAIRPIRRDSLDVEFVKKCLSRCQTDHQDTCAPSRPPAVGIKLIDCFSRMVVQKSESCQYAALSYVWSQCDTDYSTETTVSARRDKIIDKLPRLLEHSISLVRDLGIKFLWCDRYCIDQNNAEEVVTQVQQMDRIYANAELVIVAVADVDGLPGIGGMTRGSQNVFKFSNHSIVLPFQNPALEIRNSKWNSRGWTFQEAILARRCLFMCKDQAVFECNTGSNEESIPHALNGFAEDNPYILLGRRYQENNRPIKNQDGTENKAIDLYSLILEFCRRHLSYPSDRLRAMEGVFNAYRTMNKPIHNYWGIPVHSIHHKSSVNTAKDNLVKGLLWYHEDTAARNALFPSWSWAGWSGGRVTFRIFTDPGHEFSCKVWHRGANGEIVPLDCEEIVRVEATRFQNPTAHIYLEDKWLTVDSIGKDTGSNKSFRRIIFKTGIPSVFLQRMVFLDANESHLECEDLVGIIIDSHWWKRDSFPWPILVIGKKESYYERLGIVWEYKDANESEFVDEVGGGIGRVFQNEASADTIVRKEDDLWQDALQKAPTGRFRLG